VLLSCDPNGRILVVGARGASKRGVRAALYRVDDVSAALDSNVVFAKSSVSDQLVDASQPSRVLALECVAARHVALHSETLRSDELMLVYGGSVGAGLPTRVRGARSRRRVCIPSTGSGLHCAV
jgi:hypothetical protein